MPLIDFDNDLDSKIEGLLPPTYRGGKKSAIRVDYVIREWLRGKISDAEADADRNSADKQSAQSTAAA